MHLILWSPILEGNKKHEVNVWLVFQSKFPNFRKKNCNSNVILNQNLLSKMQNSLRFEQNRFSYRFWPSESSNWLYYVDILLYCIVVFVGATIFLVIFLPGLWLSVQNAFTFFNIYTAWIRTVISVFRRVCSFIPAVNARCSKTSLFKRLILSIQLAQNFPAIVLFFRPEKRRTLSMHTLYIAHYDSGL